MKLNKKRIISIMLLFLIFIITFKLNVNASSIHEKENLLQNEYDLLLNQLKNGEAVSDINKGETLRYLKKELQDVKKEKMLLQEDNEKLRQELFKRKEAKIKAREEAKKAEQEKQAKLIKLAKQQKEAEARRLKQLEALKLNKPVKQYSYPTTNRYDYIGSAYGGNLLEPTLLSASDIDNFLQGTAMAGSGQMFKNAEAETGVNASFLVALAINESRWGQSRIARDKNNWFGYGAFNANPYESALSFETPEEGTIFVASKIRKNYLNPDGKYYNGPSVEGVNIKYCVNNAGFTDFNWSRTIKTLMKKMESQVK